MNDLSTYAVFAYNARAFAYWATYDLNADRISLGSLEARTDSARYQFIRSRDSMRGATYAGVILLDGFDHVNPGASWELVRTAFDFHVRHAA